MPITRRIAERWLAGRRIRASTTALPDSFPKEEIGLMTQAEFLEFKNPDDKFHPAESYDFNLKKMNDSIFSIGGIDIEGTHITVNRPFKGRGEGFIFTEENTDGPVIAVQAQGVLYHSPRINAKRFPSGYRQGREDTLTPFGIERTKAVKYPSEYVHLVSAVADYNRRRFDHLLQNIIVKGEPLQVRSEGPPQTDKHTMLVILNSRGQIVAQGADEWGATLLTVAQEYRGRGLGEIIGRYWYEYNPSSKSGGFTSAGQTNAIRLWETRVHEFLSRGWYSELIRQGRMTQERLKAILADLSSKPRNRGNLPQPTTDRPQQKTEIRFYSEDYAFVVYDARFLDEQDEKYIHGFGFFRDAPGVGTFLYTIDYDQKFREIVTYVALQMARDDGEKVYIGQGYTDLLELDGVQGVTIEGDYVFLTVDALPLKSLAAKERRLRQKADPYDEMKVLLLEMAESKWR